MVDQLLSQSDVDALVASLSKSEPETTKSAKPMSASTGSRNINPPAIKASSTTKLQNSPAKPLSIVRPEPKSDMPMEMVNTLNAKIAEMAKQLNQVGAALKRLEVLERKVTEIETSLAKNREILATVQKVQRLDEEIKKISINLKGTPAYGVHHKFTCEKCNDQGNVATLFRCTKCGHERWYGWWPKK